MLCYVKPTTPPQLAMTWQDATVIGTLRKSQAVLFLTCCDTHTMRLAATKRHGSAAILVVTVVLYRLFTKLDWKQQWCCVHTATVRQQKQITVFCLGNLHFGLGHCVSVGVRFNGQVEQTWLHLPQIDQVILSLSSCQKLALFSGWRVTCVAVWHESVLFSSWLNTHRQLGRVPRQCTQPCRVPAGCNCIQLQPNVFNDGNDLRRNTYGLSYSCGTACAAVTTYNAASHESACG